MALPFSLCPQSPQIRDRWRYALAIPNIYFNSWQRLVLIIIITAAFHPMVDQLWAIRGNKPELTRGPATLIIRKTR